MRTTKNNLPNLTAFVDSLYSGGGTDINSGMTNAFEVISQRRYKNSVSSIFLLSDG